MRRFLLAVLSVFVLTPSLASAATFTVTNTLSAGPGSLREAIVAANAAPGADTIEFAIPTGDPGHLSGVWRIRPVLALPAITSPVTIDGASQPGSGAGPRIALDGTLAGPGTIGLDVRAGSTVIRGMRVTGFNGGGIAFSVRGSNVVESSWIGVDDGILDENDQFGILLDAVPDNRIGGDVAAVGNVISGNDDVGVIVRGRGAADNLVRFNTIGLTTSGDTLGNGDDGILVDGAPETLIADNVIAGNGGYGILLDNRADGTVVLRNAIGATSSLTTVPNRLGGVLVNGSAACVIGRPGEGNRIAGNSGDGVAVVGAGSADTVVEANRIGAVGLSGLVPAPNQGAGVRVQAAPRVRVGGAGATRGNDIVANVAGGVLVLGEATGTVIIGNRIGALTGTGLGNVGPGVWIDEASDVRVGGGAVGEGNLIARNGGPGISLTGTGARGVAVRANQLVANGGLGFDIAPDGVNLNDVGDGDAGPNLRQNFPVLETAWFRTGDRFIVTGIAPRGATIDFFVVTDPDPTGFGEADQYLGTGVEGGGNDFAAGTADLSDAGVGDGVGERFWFEFVEPGFVVAGATITATATVGNQTSELTRNLAPFSLDGDEDGDGLDNEDEIDAGTDPFERDSDGDGIADGTEVHGENPTDPKNPDTDGDGLCDGNLDVPGVCVAGEDLNVNGRVDAGETDPADPDTDDGGVDDGTEVLEHGTDPLYPGDDRGFDPDGDGLLNEEEADLGTDPLNPDTDGGGVDDGTEVRVNGTDPLDPSDDFPSGPDRDRDGLSDTDEDLAGTDPDNPDTDGDGLLDGTEVHGDNPTDPLDPDTDGDGLCDGPLTVEGVCESGEDLDADGNHDVGETDPNDADTDDDCLDDGAEVLVFGTDPLDPDSDDDGLADGTEAGVGAADVSEDTDLDAGLCIPDADPGTTTDPLNADTDGGSVPDGVEDTNRNGRVDSGERDPNDPSDDLSGPAFPWPGAEHARGGTVFGGCSSAAAAPPLGWIGLILIGLIAVAGRRRRGVGLVATTAAAAFVVISLSSTASGQGIAGLDVQHFHPQASQRLSFFNLSYGRLMPQGSWEAGLYLNYADDPFVVEDAGGDRIGNVVHGQLRANLLGMFTVHDRVEIGVDVPLILQQSGDAPFDQAGFGIGDLRLVPRFAILDSGGLGFGLAALLDMRLPTGNDEDFQGGELRIEPRLAADLLMRGGFRIGANLGWSFRGRTEFLDLGVNDVLTWGLAADVPVAERFHIVPELVGGASLLEGDVSTEESPIELLLGGRHFFDNGLIVSGGFGTGIVEGWGAPDWRIFTGVSFGTPVEAPETIPDRDRDGIPDDLDQCPDVPEDFDGVEDQDGCPEDNDGDGIPDDEDACPFRAEDFDGFEDEDGCPDPDNDGDGILDVDDACPLHPEDFDGFEDADGCPDPDNDFDSILDADDRCPLEPEVFNGVDDEDGCPDEGGLILLTCEAIELGQAVYFEFDSDVIMPRSFEMLNQVASALEVATHVRRVRVEGHTDNMGPDAYNEDLSRRRAASVRQYLLDRGLTVDRVESVGYGETRPIADNGTEEGRATNRRVEILIVEQTRCAE